VFQVGHAIHQSTHLPGSQVDRQTFVLRMGIEVFDVELGVEQGEIKLVDRCHDQPLIGGSDMVLFDLPEQVFLNIRFFHLQWMAKFPFRQHS